MKGTVEGGGEIVQVQGGHIIRATGRKDRHSKVYTSKGPRDRRVRLSAHTAIQFYDVQDRLGYDRPSKAVDWLINKAKTAIDKLNEVPNDINNPTSQTPSYLIQPNNNNQSCSSSPFVAQSFSFPGFSNEDLGLSLQTSTGNPFQESFQRMDFNGGGDVNLQGNSQMFSQGLSFSNREVLLQSSLDVHSWNHQQNYQSRERDFGNPFELGFRIPARIYGEEDDQNHS